MVLGAGYANVQMNFETYCRRIIDDQPEAGGFYLASVLRPLASRVCCPHTAPLPTPPPLTVAHPAPPHRIQNTSRVFPQLVSELPEPFPLVGKKHSGPFMWIAARGHYEFPHFDAVSPVQPAVTHSCCSSCDSAAPPVAARARRQAV